MSTSPAPATTPSLYNKNNPFKAKITENRFLTKPGSAKETRHFIINIAESGLNYLPGYSLGVFAQNPPEIVDELLTKLQIQPDTQLPLKAGAEPKAIRDLLLNNFTLNRTNKKFIKGILDKLPEGAKKEALSVIVSSDEQLDEYAFTRDYIDILNDYPEITISATELLPLLSPSNPRLYSIASSNAKHKDEVHLTVAVVRYETHGRAKKGLCSGWLADDTQLSSTEVPVFLAASKHFKLPDNPDADIIMVGPGTGIAPFRAFLEQREMDGAKGRNWLFFGDQKKSTDFLYEEEFAAWQASGLLTKMDTAFSRDQGVKIYVQDRMRENGPELWAWIQKGAYFYVCGDAKRMAKDVHQALINIAIADGGLEQDQAEEYVNKTLMKDEHRYLRDVY
jgi:sulfite reductase (NADPH) flavoprotein alpha-component